MRKGSVVYRGFVEEEVLDSRTNTMVKRNKRQVLVVHEDIIGNAFWEKNPHILKEMVNE